MNLKCNKCKSNKSINLFSGKNRICKKCRANIAKENYHKSPNKQKESNKKYLSNLTIEQKNKQKESNKKYYKKNKQKRLASNKKWRKDNPNWQKNYENNRRLNDVEYRITGVLRSRLSQAVKKQSGIKESTKKLIGCDIHFLIKYLESQFSEGMSWYNYGEWHIDHIKACANFNLKKIENQEICFHYSNLQPLWAEDNIRKSNK